uniref:Uncharacterized protein n=1 Tax=Leersia perrieri TaxID=77586 RepID=A0A0D9VQT2_9ORYZ
MGIAKSDELRSFEDGGIYRLAESGAAFVDPVRILNESYRRFRLVPSAYYSRSFGPSRLVDEAENERTEESPERKKRKRKRQPKPKPRELNQVERIAEGRHQEARPLLLKAHKSLLKAKNLLEFLPKMINEDVCMLDVESNLEKNFVELGSSWRAPFCEMTLCFQKSSGEDGGEGCFQINQIFMLNNIKMFLHDLDDNYNQGYNFIVVDPPWENGCVRQKVVLKITLSTLWFASLQFEVLYPTLPNRHLLYLPVQELAHPAGALLVLWITNREKLWKFVEEELFPSWGVKDVTVFYWLKVKPDGSLIGDLDLLHHRPYECLLVGYINLNKEDARGSKLKILEERQSSKVLASKMPGLRPESPTSPSPELRRVRTSYTGASTKLATTIAVGKVIQAKVPAEPKVKAKVEEVEKQRRRGKGDCYGTVSSTRRRSPPPSPVCPELGKTRCSWITANSEPLYVAFHDEEWGVPVHEDQKLFELLTLSQALAELTWPTILNKREELRDMFDGFNYASVSEFTDKKINSLSKSNGNMLLSEQKIRAVVTNAKQIHKVIQDFGSFSHYCWSFVNHKPLKSNFRYSRQVPIKTPKSEAISKDLMRRGFQCVGPTTIYSFMQVAGIVNDHLSCCFRYQDCRDSKKNVRIEPGLVEIRLSSPPSSEDSEASRREV